MSSFNAIPKVSISVEDLNRAIEEFYLPRHLVRAIRDIGHIPAHSQESHVGVGFIDIADYTYLSKFLSPKENQILLNGLYTAFQIVLERHHGFLNKIEGDSLMFHFDDIINKQLWKLNKEDRLASIARSLFYTCVEMQRVCVLFNQANDRFVDDTASEEARQALRDAFAIISTIRNKHDLSSTLFAFFQIRIRIGANLGEVTIGNFGPHGAKHWDVIGLPVINAKRMESTAPVGGLRIAEDFYKILKQIGVVKDYHERFKREAVLMNSVYKSISEEELFSYREVVIHEKKGASFRTYSIQVNPALPETMAAQVKQLLNHGQLGVKRILEFIKYYRGNRYVMDAIESLFKTIGIEIYLEELLELIHPKRIQMLRSKAIKENADLHSLTQKEYSLFEVLAFMDRYQDQVQVKLDDQKIAGFVSYQSTMKLQREAVVKRYEQQKQLMVQRTYFYEVVHPLVYMSIENSIYEFQKKEFEPLDVESLEG